MPKNKIKCCYFCSSCFFLSGEQKLMKLVLFFMQVKCQATQAQYSPVKLEPANAVRTVGELEQTVATLGLKMFL